MTGRTPRRARLAVLLAAPVLLLTTASCSSEHGSAAIAPYGTDSTVAVPPTVPSGSATAAGAIAVLGVGDVVFNAEQGRRMIASTAVSSGVKGIQEVLRKGAPPDLWVIALGTNDVANYQPQDYPTAINQVLAAIPAGAPVLWVDCYLDAYQQASTEFDTVLRQVLAVRGNARVVDWATVADEDGVLRD